MAVQRKYGVYKTLTAALTRAKVKKAGVTASLFLEVFLEKNCVLTAKMVFDLGLCEDPGFKAWREPLIKDGWLKYDHDLAKKLGNGSYHQPGPKLLKYINREKMASKSIVTREELDREIILVKDSLDSELSEMKETLNGIMKHLIENFDPPFSEAKSNYYVKNFKEIPVLKVVPPLANTKR